MDRESVDRSLTQSESPPRGPVGALLFETQSPPVKSFVFGRWTLPAVGLGAGGAMARLTTRSMGPSELADALLALHWFSLLPKGLLFGRRRLYKERLLWPFASLALGTRVIRAVVFPRRIIGIVRSPLLIPVRASIAGVVRPVGPASFLGSAHGTLNSFGGFLEPASRRSQGRFRLLRHAIEKTGVVSFRPKAAFKALFDIALNPAAGNDPALGSPVLQPVSGQAPGRPEEDAGQGDRGPGSDCDHI